MSQSSFQILSNSLRFRGWRLVTRTVSSLHRSSMGLRSGDWLGHSRTLMCFLSHSFVALAVCFGSLSCWNIYPRSHFQWRYTAPSIVSLMQCSCPVPLAEKHPQSIMFPPSCLTLGWCSWSHRQHSFSSKHGELSWCQRAGFWSHLNTTLSPSSTLNHCQTSDGPVHVLSWAGGPCGRSKISVLHGVVCYQLFSWLPWDHWRDPPV